MKRTTNLLSYCLIFQKYLKGFYTSKLIVLWKKCFYLPLKLQKKFRCAKLAFENNQKLEVDNGETTGVIFMDLSKS